MIIKFIDIENHTDYFEVQLDYIPEVKDLFILVQNNVSSELVVQKVVNILRRQDKNADFAVEVYYKNVRS